MKSTASGCTSSRAPTPSRWRRRSSTSSGTPSRSSTRPLDEPRERSEQVSESYNLTKVLQDAIAEAEELVANAPFIKTEQDRLEGYDYLAGRIRMAMQMAFDHDLDRPLMINPTRQFSRQGLDNPDAIYFNAYLKEGVEYVVRGRRGTSADLSFQVMGGSYSADSAASSMLAFDDRELKVAPDGSFEFRYVAEPGAKPMIVR